MGTEAAVSLAFVLPDVGVWARPSVDHLEPFHEEDSKVLGFVAGAAVDCRDDSSENLGKDVEDINLWCPVFDQDLDKLDAIHGISRREHQPRIEAMLNQELRHSCLLRNFFKQVS